MAPVSDVEMKVEVSDRKGGPLSLDDCLCPVCLEIFLEPVTLPCTHTFCKVTVPFKNYLTAVVFFFIFVIVFHSLYEKHFELLA